VTVLNWRKERRCVAYALEDEGIDSTKNLLLNLKALPVVYPGWCAVVFMRQNHWAKELIRSLGAIVCLEKSWSPVPFWRLYALQLNVDYVLLRDVNNIVNNKERLMVNEWLSSGKAIHTMGKPRIGFMGARGGLFTDMRRRVGMLILQKNKNVSQGEFERFMRGVVFEPYKDDTYRHSHGIVKRVECSLNSVLFGALDMRTV